MAHGMQARCKQMVLVRAFWGSPSPPVGPSGHLIGDQSRRLYNNIPHTYRAEQDVGGLQVPVQDGSRVDVLNPAQDLVQEVLDVLIAQPLISDKQVT